MTTKKKNKNAQRKMLAVDGDLHTLLKDYADRNGNKIEALTNRAVASYLTGLGIEVPGTQKMEVTA